MFGSLVQRGPGSRVDACPIEPGSSGAGCHVWLPVFILVWLSWDCDWLVVFEVGLHERVQDGVVWYPAFVDDVVTLAKAGNVTTSVLKIYIQCTGHCRHLSRTFAQGCSKYICQLLIKS